MMLIKDNFTKYGYSQLKSKYEIEKKISHLPFQNMMGNLLSTEGSNPPRGLSDKVLAVDYHLCPSDI